MEGLTPICTDDTDLGTSNGKNKCEMRGFLHAQLAMRLQWQLQRREPCGEGQQKQEEILEIWRRQT